MDSFDTKHVGQQVRDLRKAKGLTLSELGAAIGKSNAYVSLIERNLAEVSISALKGIAEALEVQISWFFQGQAEVPEDERAFIVRRENRRRLKFTGTGLQEELLSPGLNGESELVLTEYAPGASAGDPVQRNAEEAGVVLEGSLVLVIGENEFTLDAGDSFCMPRGQIHRSWNPGQVTTRVVWVITPPTY
ncbi:MAG: cupin domain-containing protein [Pseudomonadota bacterium]